MRGLLLAVMAAVFLMSLGGGAAEARRIRIPVPIPGSGEKLVRVVDFPDTPALLHKTGKYLDLGYKFNRFSSGGEWVAYIDSSRYVPLDKEQLQFFLMLGGLDKLPPVPERPKLFSSGSGSGTFWGVVVLLAIIGMIGKVFKRIFGLTRRAGGALERRFVEKARQAGGDGDAPSEAVLRAQMRMEQLARQQQAGQARQDMPPAPSMASAPAMPSAPPAPAAGFGHAPRPVFGQATGKPVFGQRRS